jgi:hypothetical protein
VFALGLFPGKAQWIRRIVVSRGDPTIKGYPDDQGPMINRRCQEVRRGVHLRCRGVFERDPLAHHEKGERMTRGVKTVSTLLLAVGVTLSCKDSEQCERSRMEVAKIWSRVKDGANHRRNRDDGTIKSEEYMRKWAHIENQAELVSSSFETEQGGFVRKQ